MRIANWFFLVSVLLFVSGIGLVIAGARASQQAGPEPETPAAAQLTSIASVKQIMGGITGPAATVVFDSVSTIVDAAGIQENQPRTDQEWAVVGASAAAIVESANLLVMGTRAIDQTEWVAMSKAMADAGMLALKATEAKDPQGILAAGETINQSCDDCHRKYQR